MVSAVIEQVYRSTFKFCLLKIRGICPLKCFIFTSKCTKMLLVAGLCPDLLGERTASAPPRPPSWIKGEGSRKGERRKGEDPPMCEVCWRQWYSQLTLMSMWTWP